MSLWEMESASSTGKPSSRNIAATTLLPLAMPPVRPSFSIESRNPLKSAARLGRPALQQQESLQENLGPRHRGVGGAAQARGFHRVAHKHGDGHRADPTGDGRDGAGDLNGVRMDVADKDVSLGAELFQAFGKIAEQVRSFGGIGDLVGPDIDDGGAPFDPVGLNVNRFADGGDENIH